MVRARIETTDAGPVMVTAEPFDLEEDLPSTVLRYVLRMSQPLVLSDAAAEGAFVSDSAVRRRKIRSVLCPPLTNRSKVFGVLYLENEILVGAFTDELVEIVRVLAAQAAIALDNSLLMESLQRLTGDLEQRSWPIRSRLGTKRRRPCSRPRRWRRWAI